ncbi:MAG: hypothetical protein Q8R28_14745 [Dehalococcoidia bacterium]|nr:hypothetical protein [Dehalococcoidia bacterium]
MLLSRIFRPLGVRKTLHITDLTKMGGDRVCFAGLDKEGLCVRPVLREHVRLQHLYKGDQLVVRPRARVSFELYPCRIEPPHIEDRSFEHRSMTLEGISDNLEWESALKNNLFSSVEAIFEGHLQQRRWAPAGAPTRSLGTLAQISVDRLKLEERDSKVEYRLSFVDASGVSYKNIAITDLVFRRFCDREIEQEGSPLRAARKTSLLLGRMRLYLRIGLARPWASSGQTPVCWMQINGIHTFPDYLAGESIPDLLSP